MPNIAIIAKVAKNWKIGKIRKKLEYVEKNQIKSEKVGESEKVRKNWKKVAKS